MSPKTLCATVDKFLHLLLPFCEWIVLPVRYIYRTGKCFRVTEIQKGTIYKGKFQNKCMLSEEHINTCEHTTFLYLWVRNFMAHLLVILWISAAIGLRTYDLSDFHRKLKLLGYVSYEICLLCRFSCLFQICNQNFCISRLFHTRASEKFDIWPYISLV